MFVDQTFSSGDSSLDPLINNSNEDDQSLNSPNSSPDRSRRLNMLINYGKELLCILAFILTTFASVQNNSPKISRAVTPVPFFSRGSLVEDYYFGQLNPTQTKVSLSDLSLVLYYAPWCSESQHSRAAFEHVARLFHKEAYFSAINCWQPGSECRNQYAKIHSWPILMAYQRNGFGIQYQRNLWTDGALTKFITSLLNPIQRLTTPDELLETMASKDGMIVAFIDLKTHPRHYRTFFHAALKFLEKDPFNEIGYAVVTGLSALSFGVEMGPSIRAYLWNETIEYTGNTSWTSSEINKWVNDHLQQVSIQLSPPGTKSSSLTPYLKQGPVMILFTPRNFYTEVSDTHVMLQQIGMEYYNCEGDNWVQEMARDYLFEKRKENRKNFSALSAKCRETFTNYDQGGMSGRKCDPPVSVSFGNILNSSKNFEAKFKNLPNFCEFNAPKEGTCGCMSELTCGEEKSKYSYEANSKEREFQTSMLDNEFDDRSPDAILKYEFRRRCEMLRIAERKSEILFVEDKDAVPLQAISGLACRTNKTFTLVSIDSNNFHTFAERLGIDILEVENKTTAMIMDQENESTFLLEEPVSLYSLTKFLYSYHRGWLTRFLRTNSVQYKHTHFFDVNEFLAEKKKEKLNRKSVLGKKSCETDSVKKKERHVVIKEINSEKFDESIVNSNKVKLERLLKIDVKINFVCFQTSVVLFFSANCAFCSMMTHAVLTTSRILENLPNIEFFRIDGDKNDLAW